MNEVTSGLRTWIEVDSKALKYNLQVFRSLIGKKVMLGAVAKSNAYGHDLFQFSKLIEKAGADWIIVDSIVEAEALRKNGIKKPILVLGFTLPERIKNAISKKISITVSSIAHIKNIIGQAKRAGQPVKIHLKIDTGLSRQGFIISDIDRVLKLLKQNKKWLIVEGLYTHFSSAKNPRYSKKPVETQLALFKQWTSKVKSNNFKPIIHAAATGAALLFRDTHFDMVRIGIGLYGLLPSDELIKFEKGKLTLKPALSWKTIVSEIKYLPRGSKIGYEGTEKLKKDSRVIICPIGYWHGYSRQLSQVGHVLVKGKFAKILGRISMDMIVVDATSIPNIKEGDEVVIIGRQGREEITAYDVSRLEGTSWYETITRINPLIKRVYF